MPECAVDSKNHYRSLCVAFVDMVVSNPACIYRGKIANLVVWSGFPSLDANLKVLALITKFNFYTNMSRCYWNLTVGLYQCILHTKTLFYKKSLTVPWTCHQTDRRFPILFTVCSSLSSLSNEGEALVSRVYVWLGLCHSTQCDQLTAFQIWLLHNSALAMDVVP